MRNLDRRLAKFSALVCGVDEVGRGAIAGPVVAAAVVLPKGTSIRGVDDSKKLTPRQRELLVPLIRAKALAVGIGAVSQQVIEQTDIARATFQAMRLAVARALKQLDPACRNQLLVLADGWEIPGLEVPCIGVVNGDARSAVIASASVIAKVYRDSLMCRYDVRYPGYGFARHKGYGTPFHIAALKRLGAAPVHRRSFEPVRSLVNPDSGSPQFLREKFEAPGF
ncbi:MAG: ribonuclease HII [candidate division WOR-3 bacterium]